MLTDIEIARSVKLRNITDVAREIGINDDLETYGHYMAKVPVRLIDKSKQRGHHLVLVTAISPTKAGNGKTTVSVGLALGMNHIGKPTIVALREPSLGPCFGMKGGAAGGGYAQVLPMDKINLHFTGDFHAITTANNMISALLDNYIHQHEGEGFRLKRKLWRRVVDINDRSLRQVITGLGGPNNGPISETGFDITPASEIMAIMCLATSIDDLHRRIKNILLGFTYDDKPFTVADLGVAGAITVLLKDAFNPNLVQTTEGTPALVHCGPFANIAHGCNSLVATQMGLTLSDYVITEAGFGADLGAEKFYNIKCRKSGLKPDVTVLVVTAQALKMHGGVDYDVIKKPNVEGVRRGLWNLDKHVRNIKRFGQSIVVAFNRYGFDTDEEIAVVRDHCERDLGIGFAVNDAYTQGGAGAASLARLVVDTIEHNPSGPLQYSYADDDTVQHKIEAIAMGTYGAGKVTYDAPAKAMLRRIDAMGVGHYPICIAKTQYSFSTDAKAYGDTDGYDFQVRDIVINSGAEMLVVIAGNILRMPGLPKSPQAQRIDLVGGEIMGLS